MALAGHKTETVWETESLKPDPFPGSTEGSKDPGATWRWRMLTWNALGCGPTEACVPSQVTWEPLKTGPQETASLLLARGLLQGRAR